MSFSSDAPLVANQVGDTDFPDNFEDFSELFDREYKKVTDAVNTKEGALYLLQELATFQQYFNTADTQNNRNVYRITLNFGPLPNATSKRVQHGISFNSKTRMTRMFGSATNFSSVTFIPLPFSSPTLSKNIALEANSLDVIVTTGANYSNYRDVTIVLEYTKG
jgi:hypothetical protein